MSPWTSLALGWVVQMVMTLAPKAKNPGSSPDSGKNSYRIISLNLNKPWYTRLHSLLDLLFLLLK